jgi:hypothetical protein
VRQNKNQYKYLLTICNNCEYNEDGFCIVELAACNDIKLKDNSCNAFLDKDTDWYEFYEKDRQGKY